jgi:hypothetical protein
VFTSLSSQPRAEIESRNRKEYKAFRYICFNHLAPRNNFWDHRRTWVKTEFFDYKTKTVNEKKSYSGDVENMIKTGDLCIR